VKIGEQRWTITFGPTTTTTSGVISSVGHHRDDAVGRRRPDHHRAGEADLTPPRTGGLGRGPGERKPSRTARVRKPPWSLPVDSLVGPAERQVTRSRSQAHTVVTTW